MDTLDALQADAAQLVSLAIKAGADACDVVMASGNSLSVGVRGGHVEDSKRAESNSVNLRVFCGKKIATVSSNTKNDPEKLAERAVAMAKVSPEDPFQGLAEESRLFNTAELAGKIMELDLLDERDLTPDEMEKLALEAEAAGLSVKGVAKSMGATMGSSRSGFVLATSHGFVGSFERSSYSLSSSLVAGEGTRMERDYEYDSRTHFGDLETAEEIGRKAGERVVRRLGAKQVASGTFPVVCDPRISGGMLRSMMSAINASAVARKTSFLRDRMGEQIASGNVTVIDDPLMTRKTGSRPFDGEGVATGKLEFVKDGVLQDWVLDCATARELATQTNGRASRSGSGTSPSTTNCYMMPGTQTPEEMIGEIDEGLYLVETMGHGTDMVTGDYSKGAAGFWIRNGEIAFPVSEITVAGNLKDMFMNMRPANDLVFKYGTNAPTLLIGSMTIGGT